MLAHETLQRRPCEFNLESELETPSQVASSDSDKDVSSVSEAVGSSEEEIDSSEEVDSSKGVDSSEEEVDSSEDEYEFTTHDNAQASGSQARQHAADLTWLIKAAGEWNTASNGAAQQHQRLMEAGLGQQLLKRQARLL